ncbi:hypothetical protein CAEBREN_12013 [Caenorhabditis brenneri]|uniref:F-box domain-containing protein n=1 Tax=Caenorhabditis brenneri TaxID=135651 RepID=G0N0A2_CAEBE|nr:hypothetical protein CAEBREN_12013 [Caenorhabditis brenneri]
MPPKFPLLRLPNDERLAVLRRMESIHLFILSLASKQAKILVTSANRKAEAVAISIERIIQFSCHMFQGAGFAVKLSIWKTSNEPRKVEKPKYVSILQNSRRAKPIKLKKEEYEVKDWLDHLFQIFHQKDHSLTFGRHGSCYDLDSVYENFKNPYHLRLSGTGNAEYDYRVLKMIIPRSSILLNSRILENGRPPRDTLIQNYDSFVCYKNSQLLSWKRPLDDLLCANSREIETQGFSETDINKFLKLWIRGSNPRLESLLILNVPFDYDNVLRGIQNCVLSGDQENVFKVYTVLDGTVMTGAREIRRMDGTVAGISIDTGFFFNFIVLKDYDDH